MRSWKNELYLLVWLLFGLKEIFWAYIPDPSGPLDDLLVVMMMVMMVVVVVTVVITY